MIVEKITSKYHAYKTSITVNDIAEVDKHFTERIFFAEYKQTQSDKSFVWLAQVIVTTITSLYSPEEIKQYFLDCMFRIQSKEETWMPLSEEKIFEKIMGRKVQRNTEIPVGRFDALYFETYKQNLKNHKMFSAELVGGTIDAIQHNKSMKEQYEIFSSTKRGICFLNYLNTYIIPTVGKDMFMSYVETMTNDFVSVITIPTVKNLNLDLLRTHIFGHTWATGQFKEANTNQLDYEILKIMFPHVVHTYQKPSKRKEYYQMFAYSDEHIQYCEDKVKRTDANNYKLHPASKNYDIENMSAYKIPMKKYFIMMQTALDNVFLPQREAPAYRTLMNYVNESHGLPKFGKCNALTSMQRSVIKDEYDRIIMPAKQKLLELNKLEYGKDVWKFYYKINDNYYYTKIDFSQIPPCTLKVDLKKFLWKYINDTKRTPTSLTQVNIRFIKCFEYLTEEYGLFFMSEVKEWMILSYLNHLDVTENLKPSSIANILSALRELFDFLDLDENPTETISVGHIQDHRTPTSVIPDDILLFLDKNIDNIKQRDVGLVYQIASQTGWRFNEIRNLTTESIAAIENDTEFATIKTQITKTKRARIKNRYGNIAEDVITYDLYQKILKYVNDTQAGRRSVNTDLIFFRVVNSQLAWLDTTYYNNAINRFLYDNNVTTIDETYTDFSTMQTRKTVASNLINNGASVADVQKKLGHIRNDTAQRYYIEIERKTLSELNHSFYQKKFDIYLDEEKLKLFTEEERKILYVDFCLGKREVELGECSKHPSEGRCVSLGYTSCAKCPKLCTGKKYLPKWQKLFEASNNLVSMFIEEYEKYNIPPSEYENYIEYKQEKELRDYYEVIIKTLTKED